MIETLESTGEIKLIMKFYLWLHNFSELWKIYFRVPKGNWFWCYYIINSFTFLYLKLHCCRLFSVHKKTEIARLYFVLKFFLPCLLVLLLLHRLPFHPVMGTVTILVTLQIKKPTFGMYWALQCLQKKYNSSPMLPKVNVLGVVRLVFKLQDLCGWSFLCFLNMATIKRHDEKPLCPAISLLNSLFPLIVSGKYFDQQSN